MKRPTIKLALLAVSALGLAACGGGEDEADAAVTEAPATETADGPSGEATTQAAAQESAQPELIPAPEGSLAGGEMAIGSPDAPLTIVEYASVTCPHCATFHAALFPKIKEEFIDTGKLRFVYREFPTPPVRRAQAGFILARCAATDAGPEAYFAMLDALYRTQRVWAFGNDTGAELRNIASQAGIGDEGFEKCFLRQDIREAITENIVTGRDEGVNSTPTLMIDGERFDYGTNLDEAMERIRAEVEKRQS